MELNIAEIHEALSASLGDRPCLVWRDQTWSWTEATDRTRRFANLLLTHGIGRPRRLEDGMGFFEARQNEAGEVFEGAIERLLPEDARAVAVPLEPDAIGVIGFTMPTHAEVIEFVEAPDWGLRPWQSGRHEPHADLR